METAKVFMNGKSQAVRLPKSCRFTEDEVGIARMGELIVLYPTSRKDDIFFSSLGNFTDDFFESIETARMESFPDAPRVSFDDSVDLL